LKDPNTGLKSDATITLFNINWSWV
jgi:hypothetical protein